MLPCAHIALTLRLCSTAEVCSEVLLSRQLWRALYKFTVRLNEWTQWHGLPNLRQMYYGPIDSPGPPLSIHATKLTNTFFTSSPFSRVLPYFLPAIIMVVPRWAMRQAIWCTHYTQHLSIPKGLIKKNNGLRFAGFLRISPVPLVCNRLSFVFKDLFTFTPFGTTMQCISRTEWIGGRRDRGKEKKEGKKEERRKEWKIERLKERKKEGRNEKMKGGRMWAKEDERKEWTEGGRKKGRKETLKKGRRKERMNEGEEVERKGKRKNGREEVERKEGMEGGMNKWRKEWR